MSYFIVYRVAVAQVSCSWKFPESQIPLLLYKFGKQSQDYTGNAQITGVSIVCWTVVQTHIKDTSLASLVFVRGIHWWPPLPHQKGPVTPKKFPSDDVIMIKQEVVPSLDRVTSDDLLAIQGMCLQLKFY